MDDLISRQAAIDALHMHLMYRMGTDSNKKRLDDWINGVPSAQPEQRWNRLMMYLADLQLTYSPGWGANGQGDEKIYEFVTGLIDELQGWEEEAT